VDRQFRKRKEENRKPSITQKRVIEEKEKWDKELKAMKEDDRKKAVKERGDEEKELVGMLKEKDLPLIGLPGERADGKKREKNEKKEAKRMEKEEGEKEDVDGDQKKSFGSKFKRSLLGRQLAEALEKRKDGIEGELVEDDVKTARMVAKEGPGWKLADKTMAQASVSGGAARAEAMANRIAADKGREA